MSCRLILHRLLRTCDEGSDGGVNPKRAVFLYRWNSPFPVKHSARFTAHFTAMSSASITSASSVSVGRRIIRRRSTGNFFEAPGLQRSDSDSSNTPRLEAVVADLVGTISGIRTGKLHPLSDQEVEVLEEFAERSKQAKIWTAEWKKKDPCRIAQVSFDHLYCGGAYIYLINL